MDLEHEFKRLIFAIKQNYYDPEQEEKYLGYAPDASYSQFLDLVYQLCAFMVGHHHPGQLSLEDISRFLDNPVIALKAAEVMPALEADVLARLAELKGSSEAGKEAYDALVQRLLSQVPGTDGGVT